MDIPFDNTKTFLELVLNGDTEYTPAESQTNLQHLKPEFRVDGDAIDYAEELSNSFTWFPHLDDYAYSIECPNKLCAAETWEVCNIRNRRNVGNGPFHIPRLDKGMNKYRRDVKKAPNPEHRIYGTIYHSLIFPPGIRRRYYNFYHMKKIDPKLKGRAENSVVEAYKNLKKQREAAVERNRELRKSYPPPENFRGLKF